MEEAKSDTDYQSENEESIISKDDFYKKPEKSFTFNEDENAN